MSVPDTHLDFAIALAHSQHDWALMDNDEDYPDDNLDLGPARNFPDDSSLLDNIVRNFPVYSGHSIKGAFGDEGPWFRLLRISPGSFGMPIYCNFARRPVYEAAQQYLALSYSWGKGARTQAIYFGDKYEEFYISPHLWQALRRLRSRHQHVQVWIDRICINQTDITERNSQLQIMPQIYGQATNVIIWLGEGANLINHDFSKLDSGLRASGFRALCNEEYPWWTRLWVLQECIYSENCPIVMLGPRALSLADFLKSYEKAVTWSPSKGLRNNYQLVERLYTAWYESVTFNQHRQPMVRRLRDTTNLQCTDPRDRIFALLNVTSQKEADLIKVDYGKSIPEIGRQVVAALLKCKDWYLDDFMIIQNKFFETQTSETNSTMNMWESMSWTSRIPCGPNPLTSAKSITRIDIGSKVLFIDAVFVDKIDYVLDFASFTQNLANRWSSWETEYAKRIKENDRNKPVSHIYPRPFVGLFVKETIHKLNWHRKQPVLLQEETLGAVLSDVLTLIRQDLLDLDGMTKSNATGGSSWSPLRNMLSKLTSEQIFTTERGLVGLMTPQYDGGQVRLHEQVVCGDVGAIPWIIDRDRYVGSCFIPHIQSNRDLFETCHVSNVEVKLPDPSSMLHS